MKENKNTAQVNIPEEENGVEISELLRMLLRSFSELWWLVVLLATVAAAFSLMNAVKSYKPLYKAEATFTVETYNVTQSGYTFFYDNKTAAQMALTFPYLLDSDLLLERVKADMGVEVLNGTPSAKVIENSNLFTLSVTSRDPQAAYDILQSLIKNYPAVAEYVIGKTQLNMIDYPEFPSLPTSRTQYVKAALRGCVIGVVLGIAIVTLYAVFRNTVRRESDITDKLYANCLGIIPMVSLRKNQDLSIHNSKVGTAYKESFRGLALQTVRMMEDRKVLLITATTDKEGASTVARNLADALIEQGKKVALLDSDAQNLNEIQQLRETMDYVVIDAPACKNLSSITPFIEQADAILYTIRQDYTKLPAVKNCFEDLNHFEARLIGCVLNGVNFGGLGYGYGYGYGCYGSYGYGEGKGSKAAEDE